MSQNNCNKTKDTENELKFIESILLPKGFSFDKERRDFIFSNDESFDLVACAGSGKTTALLAKLLLLEKQLPFENNKGICVLTHTNVAIDQIKNKIGNSSRLFKYPNFFGTIQQFVDKFVAIPAYKNIFNKPPIIDDDYYNAQWNKKYLYLNPKAKYFCKRNPAKRFPESIRNNLNTDKLSESLLGDELNVNIPNISDYDKNRVLNSIGDRRNDIIQSGALSFDDAYYFANAYINSYPYVSNVISTRFKYVFIDEMQDTSKHQFDILNKIFNNNEIIIQRIGDPNQAIYSFGKEDECVWSPTGKYKSLKGSLRFSKFICECISGIRLQDTDELYGNSNIKDIKPYLILYKSGEEENVIPKFIELIEYHRSQLSLTDGDKIKVVGLNGKGEAYGGNQDSIQKYYPQYLKSVQNKKRYYKNLLAYIELSKQKSYRGKDFKVYTNLFLEILSRFLYEQGVNINGKNPTAGRIYSYLKDNSDFRKDILLFSTSLFLMQADDSIKEYLKNSFLKYFGDNINLTHDAKMFIENEHVVEDGHENLNLDSNICGKIILNEDNSNNFIPIVVSSIHGVKGETHKATLYLETKYYQYDIEEILNHLSKKSVSGGLSKSNYRQRIAYVGMSRASHLLCVAMRKDVFENNFKLDPDISAIFNVVTAKEMNNSKKTIFEEIQSDDFLDYIEELDYGFE